MRKLLVLLMLASQPALAVSFTQVNIPGREFYADVQHLKYQTNLSFVLFPESGWTVELLKQHMSELAEVYRQCDIEFSQVSVYTPTDFSLPPQLSKYKMDDPNSILNLAKHTVALKRPLVFLVGDISDDSEATPFSRASFTGGPIAPRPLESTVWMPMYANSPKYLEERKASPYSVLAHELTHILTLDGEHNNEASPDLLTIYRRRTNRLTPKQCKQIVNSPFVND